jgi:guanylate kinase
LETTSDPLLRRAVTATTRPPRLGERADIDYHFLTVPAFEEGIREGLFLEYARVHGTHYYGTPRAEVEPHRAKGIGVVLVIDVQGAAQVRRKCPDALTIFLLAPSWEVYEERLRHRGTETEASIRTRLETARQELARAGEFEVKLENDTLDNTVTAIRSLVTARFRGTTDAR